ncbi:MAG: carboxypeptidase regulatory-like domain-containing protein [Bacteroidota bacterium]|nr:carboxypeptidase regulatory-like domain-containing protein [Bacteroidota bacterium]
MNKSIIKTASICITFFVMAFTAQAQSGYGEIRGIIKDMQDLQPVPYATVKITQGDYLVGGTTTDENGKYKYKPLTPGTYEIYVSESGHQTQPVHKITVTPNEATYVDVKLASNTFTEVVITAKAYDYTKSGVDKTMYTMVSVDAKDLLKNASFNAGDIKGSLAVLKSDVIEDSDGEVHVRGSRGDATAYFVDGVRTISPNTIPNLSIENLTFFSGGVPAMYGDLTSGAVIVTTKSYFSGIRDKNIRVTQLREKIKEEKALQKAKEDEEKRLKEIEEEKKVKEG